MSFSAVYQSYQDDGMVSMEGFVQSGDIYVFL